MRTFALAIGLIGILGFPNLVAAEKRPSSAHVAVSLGDGTTVESKNSPKKKLLSILSQISLWGVLLQVPKRLRGNPGRQVPRGTVVGRETIIYGESLSDHCFSLPSILSGSVSGLPSVVAE